MKVPRVLIATSTTMVLVAVAAVTIFLWLRHTDPVPEDWNPAEFRAAVARWVDPDGEAQVDVELLAWSTQEDDRPHPLLLTSALAWARIETRQETRWALALLYRHPRAGPEWHISDESHGPIPVRYYVNRPRNLEVYAFLDSERPSFFKTPGFGFRILSSAVRKLTWHDATGERPGRFYP